MKLLKFFAILFLTQGCSSTVKKVSRWMGLEEAPKPEVARAPASETDNTTLSEQEVIGAAGDSAGSAPNLGQNEFSPQSRLFNEKAQNGYRRNVDPWTVTGNYNEGSLWNADSQDNYLFTRNMLFKVGDFVMIKIEPDLQETLNAKLTALYKPANSKPSLKDTVTDEAGKAAGAKVGEAVEKAIGNKAIADAAAGETQSRTVAAFTEKARFFTTKEVPVRIVEITSRGAIKVEGAKKLFLKNGAFDLKVSGVLREEDIGPSKLVASSRLMDSKVEIIK